MKKITMLWLLIVTILCAISVIGCKEDPQLQILVTDIPYMYNGYYGITALGNSNGTTVAMSDLQEIRNGRVLTKLNRVVGELPTSEPYTETGKYLFVFMIFDGTDEYASDYYSGGLFSLNVSEEVTTVPFYGLMDLDDLSIKPSSAEGAVNFKELMPQLMKQLKK